MTSTRRITNEDLSQHLERLETELGYLRRNLVDSVDYEELSLRQCVKEAKCRRELIYDAVRDGELPARHDGYDRQQRPRMVVRRGDLKRWNARRLGKS